MNKFDDFVFCPVPLYQRPFYEYIKRKKSTLLSWVKLNEGAYFNKFFFSFLTFFSLSSFFTNWFISFFYYPVRTLIISLILSLFLQIIFYFNFFLAWESTGKKLLDMKIIYEELGGYMTRIWVKPNQILRHEQLLYYYQLVPLINRLQKTLQLIFFLLLIFVLFLTVSLY